MEKATKTQVKEFWRQSSPTVSSTKTEAQLRAWFFQQPLSSRTVLEAWILIFGRNAKMWNFLVGKIFFPFIHTASESEVWLVIKILAQLMSKWNYVFIIGTSPNTCFLFLFLFFSMCLFRFYSVNISFYTARVTHTLVTFFFHAPKATAF